MSLSPNPGAFGGAAGPATLPGVRPGQPAGGRGLLLQVSQLSLQRNGQRLLDGINLQLSPNELVGILALSGAGKTSLLKLLAGFHVPAAHEGQIVFDNQPLTEHSIAAYRAMVGYVPQDDLLYRSLTGRENLWFAAQLRLAGQAGPKEIKAIIAATLERLGLQPEEADRPVTRLSGGQRRRLNVALELLARPRLLLLDEPTAGLDPASESRLMRLLQRVAHSGTTVACATHVLANLHRFDRVIVLADHLVSFSGSPKHLLDHYQAASFTELYERLEDHAHHPAAPPAEPEPALDIVIAPRPRPSTGRKESPPTSTRGPSTVNGSNDPLLLSPSARESRPRPCLGLTAQVRVLTWRGFRSLWRDGWWLFLLTVSPLIVGGLINLSQTQAGSAFLTLTFAVVAALWLGLTNSVREVVRDRKHYARERLLGIDPTGYLTAKAITFGLIGLAQVSLLWLVLRYAHVPEGDTMTGAQKELTWWPWWQVLAVLWGSYLAALSLGFIVSTLAGSEEWAVAMLPLLILPQLLLTGAATQTGGDSPQQVNGEWFCPLRETWTALRTPAAADSPEEASPQPEEMSPQEARPFDWRWIVEGASALTYSRPALDILHPHWVRKTSAERKPSLVDAAHLVLAIGGTALAAWLIFRWRERRWLDGV